MAPSRRTAEEKYDTTTPLLKELLGDIDHGRIAVPRFHRMWCWSAEHTRRLIASVAEGAPIGSVVFMGARPIGHRAFESGRSNDVIAPPLKLVVDGQQRLTALYQACFRQEPVRIKVRSGFEYRLFYFQMDKAINERIPLEEAVLSIPVKRDGSSITRSSVDYADPAVQFALGIFPASELLDFRSYERRYFEFWDAGDRAPSRPAAIQMLQEFRSVIAKTFEVYKVPVHTIRESVSIGEIIRIFENANLAA